MRGYAAIGLYNPKWDVNVGGVLRAAYCFGAKLVVVNAPRFKRQPTDTNKSWRHIPILKGDPYALMPIKCIPIAVEIVKDCRYLHDFTHPKRAMYFFGPEDGSVPNKVMQQCKHTIRIPSVTCLNLAASVNVVLYDRMAKQLWRS